MRKVIQEDSLFDYPAKVTYILNFRTKKAINIIMETESGIRCQMTYPYSWRRFKKSM